jgi:Tfp pilus assembly protein PilO
LREVQQLKNLSLREKIMLAVLAICILGFAYYKLFLTPVLAKVDESKANIDKYNLELVKIKAAAAAIPKLKEELAQLQADYDEKTKILPQLEKNPEIAYNLKVLTDKNSMVLSNASFGEPAEYVITAPKENKNDQTAQPAEQDAQSSKAAEQQAQSNNGANQPQVQPSRPEPKIYAVPVSIGVTGSYINTMGLIKSLENDTRVASVNSLSIAAGENGSLSTSIMINYYYMDTGEKVEEKYDFNNGTYGKTDLFK